MSASKALYFGGIPTDPDVNLLMKKFSEISDEVISYGEIEDCIALNKDSNRFKSVVSAWRKKVERETGELLIPVIGIGLKKATPSERIGYSGKKVKSGTRAISRGAVVASSTDRSSLTDEQKRVCDHFSRAASVISSAMRVAPKSTPLPVGM